MGIKTCYIHHPAGIKLTNYFANLSRAFLLSWFADIIITEAADSSKAMQKFDTQTFLI
jgi:hypothetical protein